MIPGGPLNFTYIPIVGEYTPPISNTYDPLFETVEGGIAIGDPSQGRLYQYWTIDYDGRFITVRPASGGIALQLQRNSVSSVSLAFDANMSPVIAYQVAGTGAFLYYYDTLTSQYVEKFYPTAISSRVVVDQPANWYVGNSDVMFGYTTVSHICYRQQRDRYDIEYVIQPTTCNNAFLKRLGLSNVNRLQFQVHELQPPLPEVDLITPNSGTTLGGTPVTIEGLNFTSVIGVTFNDVAATGLVLTSKTSINCVTPAGTAGTASVIVTTVAGVNPANSLYTYIAPPPPPIGKIPFYDISGVLLFDAAETTISNQVILLDVNSAVIGYLSAVATTDMTVDVEDYYATTIGYAFP